MSDIASPDTKYWHQSQRCPNCLTLGELRPIHGNYVCDKCDQRWSSDWLGHWNKAFEAGRQFERANWGVAK